MIEINLHGCNRIVFLTKRYAFKVPNCRNFFQFCWGLIDNMHERRVWKAGHAGICPLVFSIPGGFLNVMPRARVMTEEEFASFDSVAFRNRGDYWLTAEDKASSFGWLNGEIVALDYGN